MKMFMDKTENSIFFEHACSFKKKKKKKGHFHAASLLKSSIILRINVLDVPSTWNFLIQLRPDRTQDSFCFTVPLTGQHSEYAAHDTGEKIISEM
jgi:hypothetical protein